MKNIIELVPEAKHQLLKNETRAYAFLATLMKDGSPQLTPIWFNVEKGQLTINTAQGRVKDRNLQRNPKLALVIMDFTDPLEYVQIRGEVVDRSEEGAVEHIHALAQKYQGRNWPIPEGQVRVKYRIRVDSVS